MVNVGEIARFMPGERMLRLDESQGGKKSGKKKVVRKPLQALGFGALGGN